TFVHVTHTQPESIALADMGVVMDTGRIDQADTANASFDRPETPYVARFMGRQNVRTGTGEKTDKAGGLRLTTAAGAAIEAASGEAAAGAPLSVSVRRDRISLRRGEAPAAGEVNAVAGTVTATEYQGTYVKVTLDVDSDAFVANVPDDVYF